MTDKFKTRKQLLHALEKEREDSLRLREAANQRELELAALLAASRSVSEFQSFKDSARAIFDIAKGLIGAEGGYVALLSDDGSENQVLFLDSGGRPCTVDESLPMPIRGLRARVFETGIVAYENEFSGSEWQQFMPEGHLVLENVMFAPLTIEDKVVGLIGLANKPGGFDDSDARLATVFGDFAAVSLSNDYSFESLERSEERFRSVTQSANDAIVTASADGKIVSWNKGARKIFGYEEADIIGQPLTILMPESYRDQHTAGMERYLDTGIPKVIGRTVEMHGVRSDGSSFPLELSLSTWKTNEGAFFTGIIRDITRRKRAEELSEALNAINGSINSTLELPEIIRTTIVEATRALEADASFIIIPGNGKAAITNTSGLPAAFQDLELDEAVIEMLSQASIDRAPIVIGESSAGDGLKELPQSGIHTLLPVRLTTRDELMGVIVFGYQDALKTFSNEELDFAAKLSTSVSLSMKNALLYHGELESRSVCQNYANQLSILHEIGLSLNRETDKNQLLNKVLRSAAELVNAGVGIMTLTQDGSTRLVSNYYATWMLQRCTISGTIENLHQRITSLQGGSDKDAFRVASAEYLGGLPDGHMPLRGLIVGIIRDTRGRSKGLFMLSHKAGNSEFNESDEEIIALLAAQCSVALVSAENFEREHVVAETLQDALLPETPVRDDIDVGLLYQSSGPLGKIGGDFYDFVELDDRRIAVVVGDVCGKGLAAATYTAMIKYMLRAYLGEGMLPGDCLTRLNRNIHNQVSIEKFVTVGLSLIDLKKGTVSYSSAGHPPPIICQGNKPSELFTQPAVPLGVIPDQKFLSTQVNISANSLLVMYTDGLMDARTAGGEPFGQSGIIDSVGKACKLPAQKMAQSIIDAALSYAGGSLRDDIAILVLRLRGDSAASAS